MERLIAISLAACLAAMACGGQAPCPQPPSAADQASAPAAAPVDAPTSAEGTAPPIAHESGLPPELDALFPPKAKQPIFLFAMLKLGGALDSVVADALEKDMAGAKQSYQQLQQAYAKAAKLVPAWQMAFPTAPLEAIGKALGSGQPGPVMGSVQALGKVCEGCHDAHMVAVQQRYHWGHFDEISVDDPLMHKPVHFTELMQGLAVGLSAVGNDLRQGQVDGAKKQLAGFKARFDVLQKTCSRCHKTKRQYFVDESVMAHFDAMDKALSHEPVDGKAVAQASMAIGKESCFGCHLVHVPAALSRSH